MNPEETLRSMLHQEAATHRVNSTLPRAAARKARMRRALVVSGVAGAVALSVLGGVTAATYVDGGRGSVAPSSPEERAPEPIGRTEAGAPLVLLDQQEWRVSYIDQYGTKDGEIAFRNGSGEVELHWRAATLHDSFVQDRQADAESSSVVRIMGREARVFEYTGAPDFTALWLDEDLSLELRAPAGDLDEFETIAAALEGVDEDAWLAAMPPDTVLPEERAETVDQMLADVPVHPDVDVDELKSDDSVGDRYQVGAEVTGAVACAWIGQWLDARANDDAGAAREAVDAMATAREWSILIEMKDQGGWTEAVWGYADAVVQEREDQVDEGLSANGKPVGFASGLGCASTEG